MRQAYHISHTAFHPFAKHHLKSRHVTTDISGAGMRVAHACEIIRKNAYSENYLKNLFKRRFGMTMSEFRRKAR